MADIKCTSYGKAIAALETIASSMPRGTQKDVLTAIQKFIDVNRPTEFSDATIAKLQKIFEGDEHDKLAREWLNAGGRHMEPPHGTRVLCLYDAKLKAWVPELLKHVEK